MRSEDAIKYLERARQLDPENHELIGQLIRTYLGLGEIKDAISYLDGFLATSSDVDEMVSLGNMFEMRGIVEPTRKIYERAVELAKSPEKGPHIDLGNVYMALKEVDLALREYGQLVKSDPSSLAAVYNYGYALSLSGDPRARGYFERAIDIFEQADEERTAAERVNALQAMSHAYMFVGKKQKALELLTDALERAKKQPAGRRIFSSIQYKYIPTKEFIQETALLRRKVSRR